MKEHVRLRRARRTLAEAQNAHLANDFARSNRCALELWRLGERARSAYHQFYYHHRVTRNYVRAEQMISYAIQHGLGTQHAWHNLGLARREQGRVREAMDAFAAALELQPDFIDALVCFGNAAWECGEESLAQGAWDRALAIEATEPSARYDQGCQMILLQRQYLRGWQQYGARWDAPLFRAGHHRPAGPAWDGQPVSVLFAFAEQGNGDAIMLLRWLPWMLARCERLHLAVHQPLVQLVREHFPAAIVQRLEDPLPAYHAQVSLFELPALAGLDDPTHVPPAPYLAARPTYLGAPGARVGLLWAGGTGTAHDWRRSLPFEAIRPLLDLKLGWHILQLERLEGFDAARLPTLVWHRDVGPLPNFAATARALTSLGLLITVDTATAHLAGALGVPTWLLLPRMPDFRWGLTGERTSWYPSMRLFRQREAQNWTEVVARVRGELANRMDEAWERPA